MGRIPALEVGMRRGRETAGARLGASADSLTDEIRPRAAALTPRSTDDALECVAHRLERRADDERDE